VLALVVFTTLPWAILHLIRTFYANSKHHQAPNSLPLPLSGDAGRSRRRGTWDIGPLWLKYETTRWNLVFSSSILTLFSRAQRRHSLNGRSIASVRLARWAVWFYAVGAALCVLVMTLGMVLLLWSAFGMVWRVARLLGGGTGYLEPETLKEGVKRLVKRASTEEEISTYDANAERPRLHALVMSFLSLYGC
jgi:fatty acid desaturase